MPRFLARFWPRPFGLDPMAGIVTSQPMSKITLRRISPQNTAIIPKTARIGAAKFWQNLNRGENGIMVRTKSFAKQLGSVRDG